MLPIKEQISSVYRNKSSITFLHVRVYRGFMCICGKKRKYSCFAGNNSLFYVPFSLTVIALTWKLSWHFVGNKNVRRMFFAEFHNPGPQFIICGRRHLHPNSRVVYRYIQQKYANQGHTSRVLHASGQIFHQWTLQQHCEKTNKQTCQFERMLRKMFLTRKKQKWTIPK